MGFSTIGGASTGGSAETPAAGASNAFKNIKVSGQSDVVADSTTDDLTFVNGSNVTITTNAGADSVTIAAAGGTLAGIDDQSSSNDDQITIADTVVTINIDGDDVDFVVESENNAKMLMVNGANDTVGIGCDPVEAGANNPSALLVVSNRGTASTPAEYSPLIVENDAAAAYVNIISNDNGWTGVLFGDQTDPDEAGIKYNSNNKRMYFTGNAEAIASNVLTVDHSANTVGVNVGAPAAGALDVDGVLALKSTTAPSATADYGKIYSLGTGQTTVANTRLLIHGDLTRLGEDGETTMVDHGATGHTVTAVGTAQKDTAQSKYGGSSILLDGNSDYLSAGDHADWDFGAGDFTVEMFVRFASVTGQQTFLSLHGGTTGSREIYWTKQADGKMWCYYYYGSEDSDTALNQAWGPSVDTWYHVAMCRDGANLRFFVDGTQLGSTHDISTRDLQDSGYALQIGSLLNTSDALVSYLNGWVDEIRISKGTAHYTANFTAPTAAFSGKGELYVQNGAGTATKISPHNLKGEWEYYSKNQNTGKTVRINMEEVVSDLGKLTGKNYIKDE